MAGDDLHKRKDDHLSIVANEDVAFQRGNLLDCVQLEHRALPELDLRQIDTATGFFGKRLNAPLMITSMTGGADFANELNTTLAAAANQAGIAFSTGSQRVMLEKPETIRDFAVRDHIPDSVLLGNIGAQQLLEYSTERIIGLVASIEADGLCIHLNAAHELAQAGGERKFQGHLAAIRACTEALEGRVLVKETGNGISVQVAVQLAEAGVNYIDVAGAGGTSWPRVESYRQTGHLEQVVANTFSEWGLPTAACTIGVRQHCPRAVKVIASGGIMNGLDVARAIAIGADIVGFARIILNTVRGQDGRTPVEFIECMVHELKAAMLLTGCLNLTDLKTARRMYTGELRDWLADDGLLSAGHIKQ